MHGGLENAPLRLLAAETVISAVLSTTTAKALGPDFWQAAPSQGLSAKEDPFLQDVGFLSSEALPRSANPPYNRAAA